MPVITKKQATLHTANVDVKILRLDGKQVTLSVFRQLPEATIFEDELDVNGRVCLQPSATPWGIVRYTWADSPKWADYYLVWEMRGVLYRLSLAFVYNLLEMETDTLRQVFDDIRGFESEWGRFSDNITGASWVDSLENHFREFEALNQLFIAV